MKKLNICLLSTQKKNSYLKKLISILQENKNDNVILLNKKITKTFIKKKKINFLVSFHNSQILKQNIISLLNNNCINFHCSLLPQARGSYPILWAAYKNLQFGVSIHRIDRYLDNGNILFQKKIKLNKNQTLKSAYNLHELTIIKGFSKLFKIIRKEILLYGSFKYKINNKTKYKSSFYFNSESQKLIKLLPKGWNTKISEVKKIKF